MQDVRKWILGSYLLTAVVAWIFFYYLTDTIWDAAEFPVPADWFLMPSQIIAFVVAAAIFVVLQRHVRINQFSNEVASELSKVSWPERKETVLSTGVVAVMVVISALLLFLFDSLWGTFVKVLY